MSVEKESCLLYICLQRSHKCTPGMAIKPHMFYAPENQLSFVADVMESGVINFFPNGRIIFLLALSKKSIYMRCQCCPSAQHDDKAFEGRVPQKFWGNTDPASLFTEI